MTYFTPTDDELNQLKLASDYGLSVWQSALPASKLLGTYPLAKHLTTADIDTLVKTWADTSSEAALKTGLRQLRALLMLRWIWADALSLISLEELTTELSDFADTCLRVVKAFVYTQLTAKYGKPIGKDGCKQTLIIVAMGKLGARELNLSSDIDLVFLYGCDGRTQTEHDAQKSIEIKRFMITWGQRIIHIISNIDAQGFVHRIDMRLRPWGDGSDLAISLKALSIYFAKHGRHWERFAWLKARVVSGEASTEAIDGIIKLFVYRYYVDYTAFAALREMKSLILQQQRRRFDEDNIKLGAGGIRDIEFIVQAYQLIYGGTETQLQVKACLPALEQIRQAGLISDKAAADLASSYRFLRRTEHAIQALEDKQTQKLPKTQGTQTRLAHTLGFDTWQSYLDTLNQHKHNVITPFNKLVVERNKTAKVPSQNEAKPCQDLTEKDENNLTAFLHSSAVRKLPAEAKTRLDDVWHDVRLAIAASGNTAVATERMIKFLEAVVNRSIYLVLLKENPKSLHHLVKMMVASPWISQELTRYPVLLDEFLQKRFKPLPSKSELTDRLRRKLLRVEPDDEEGHMAVLRLFKKSQVLHVAASDLLADKPLMKVSDALTNIAEVVLEAALQLVYAQLTRKYGFVKLKSGERASLADSGFGIIGYGKLGGIELSYSSDLDLVFLHDIDEHATTDGNKPVSGMRFITRVGQKLMSLLGTQTRDGRAYEVDMRLRPSGQSGLLVSSLSGFTNYQKNSAWLWEHQALVRARPICGNLAVLLSFTDIRKDTLCMRRSIDTVRTEVLQMREKMRGHLGSNKTDRKEGLFHLKQDAGGIIDIEFMAQFCVLALSHKHTQLAIYSDNVRIFNQLAKLAEQGAVHELDITAAQCHALVAAYLEQRATTHRLALAEQSLQVEDTKWSSTRAFVKKMWHKLVVN